MKNSDLVIRALRMLPEVYSDESRDFLLFTKLIDAVFNSCKFNTDMMLYISDPRNVNDSLLGLLADKFGIDVVDANELTNNEIRYILCCLPYLIRNKGSLKAIEGMINMYFKIYHILGTYTVSVSNKTAVVQGITLSGRTIILGIEGMKLSTTMLKILAKYLLPPGYSFFVYFYSKIDEALTLLYDDNITILFTSNNINSEIDLEIPDFIKDATYKWIDQGDVFELSARVDLLISAVDAHQITSINTDLSREFFIGYIYEDELTILLNNFRNAELYNNILDPTIVESLDPNINYYEKYSIVIKDGIHKILVPDYRLFDLGKLNISLFKWRTIELQSTVIVNSVSRYSIYPHTDILEIGDIYFVTTTENNCLFNKLTFKGSYKILPNYTNKLNSLPQLNMNDFDYCCLLDGKLTPFLHVSDELEDILLHEAPAVNRLPLSFLENELRLNLSDGYYYHGIDNLLNTKIITNKTKFKPSLVINQVVFTNDSFGNIYVEGAAYGYTRYTVQDNISIKKDHIYVILGCPKKGTDLSYCLRLMSLDSTHIFNEFGDGLIIKSDTDINNAILTISIEDRTELTKLKFTPEIYDITDTSFSKLPENLDELISFIWSKVNEGPILSGLYLNNLKIKANSVIWKSGGDYYIKYKAPGSSVSTWQRYTYPLFMVKIILTSSSKLPLEEF